MQDIKLKHIELLNFKGVQRLSVDFGDVTEVRGANATGKTTLFDAFLWTLFGKDSLDRKQFDIKTLDEAGRVIPRLPHEVTVVLAVGEEQMTFCRKYNEKWVKRKGSAEEEFAGHEEQRLFNGVPCSVADYKEKVAAVCDEDTFKLLTNPNYFTALKPLAQREMLMKLVGEPTNEQVAGDDEGFAALLGKLTGKTMAEYGREINAKKKVVKAELEGIPQRIEERRRDIDRTTDYTAVRERRDNDKGRLDTLLAQIADGSKANEAAAAKRNEAIKALDEKREALRALRSAHIDAYYVNRTRLISRKSDLEAQLQKARKNAADIDDTIAGYTEKREALRAEYKQLRALSIDESNPVCPYCGQPIAADNEGAMEKIRALYEENATKLRRNIEKGTAVGDLISKANNDKKIHDGQIAELNEALAGIEIPSGLTNEITERLLADDEKAVELMAEIAALEAGLKAEANVPKNTEKEAEIAELRAAIDEDTKILAREEQSLANERRITELEAQQKTLAQQLADLEKDEFEIARFTKRKIELVERAINGLFTIVRWKMYDQQINGGEVETCEATVDGVPYSSLNNAMRINAGIDIINTFCRARKLTAPIFIDNAEAVNALLPTPSQTIRLVVTEDKQLNIINH